MRISNTTNLTSYPGRANLGVGKARCMHCYREFQVITSFHLVCKNCKAEDDDRGSFERMLQTAI